MTTSDDNAASPTTPPEKPGTAATRPTRARRDDDTTADKTDKARSRIAQAGRRVRAASSRVLAQEEAPRKRTADKARPRPRRALRALMAAPLSPEDMDRLVEFTDADNRPLLCMRPESAPGNGLFHRRVVLALRTRDNRVLLHRCRDPRLGQPECWDLYTSFVMVGEAGEDAAVRLLAAVGLAGLTPRMVREAGPDDGSRAHRALFVAQTPPNMRPLPLPAPEETTPARGRQSPVPATRQEELLEVDSEELAGLLASAPELFSPETHWAAGSGLLFN